MTARKESDKMENLYLNQVEEVIKRLDMANSKTAQRIMQGRRWHVLYQSPNSGFYNTTLDDAFDVCETSIFRYIDCLGYPVSLNPILCTIKRTSKEMVELDWGMMCVDNAVGGTRDKYIVRNNAIKEKCEEIYKRDCGYKEESADEYKKVVEKCIFCLDVNRRKSQCANEMKDVLIHGLMYMYDALNSVSLCTTYNDGIISFPIDNPEVLNKEFKNRDIEDGKTRKTTVYSDVKSHYRKNGVHVDSHVRSSNFTYKNRSYWVCLSGDSVIKTWDIFHSEKAKKRALKAIKNDLVDDMASESTTRIYVDKDE